MKIINQKEDNKLKYHINNDKAHRVINYKFIKNRNHNLKLLH